MILVMKGTYTSCGMILKKVQKYINGFKLRTCDNYIDIIYKMFSDTIRNSMSVSISFRAKVTGNNRGKYTDQMNSRTHCNIQVSRLVLITVRMYMFQRILNILNFGENFCNLYF